MTDLAARRLAALVLAAAALILPGCSTESPVQSDGRTPVWIDADPAIGEPDRDVDDGFALVQAFRSATLAVRGVSAVFGSAPLVRTWPITQDVVARFGPEGMRPWRGASGPHELRAPTEASEALTNALRAERLTLIALGPLTNIAATLHRDPSLHARVERIVAVAGHRPGQGGAPETAAAAGQEDINVALDVEAMRVVLESGVPLTLVPVELGSRVQIEATDLARLAQGPIAARFLAESSTGWLRHRQQSGAGGFHTPGMLAVDSVATPGRLVCLEANATIERIDGRGTPVTEASGATTASVVVREDGEGRPVTYCHTPDEGAKGRLLDTLLR